MVESAKKFLRKVPIPICGLILGMVSLGIYFIPWDMQQLGPFIVYLAVS